MRAWPASQGSGYDDCSGTWQFLFTGHQSGASTLVPKSGKRHQVTQAKTRTENIGQVSATGVRWTPSSAAALPRRRWLRDQLPFSETLGERVQKPRSSWRPDWLTDEMIKGELQQTEAGIASGEWFIADQRARLNRLEHSGSDTNLANELLTTFLQTQVLQAQHRDLLQRELRA
jgi:hypothetical protein